MSTNYEILEAKAREEAELSAQQKSDSGLIDGAAVDADGVDPSYREEVSNPESRDKIDSTADSVNDTGIDSSAVDAEGVDPSYLEEVPPPESQDQLGSTVDPVNETGLADSSAVDADGVHPGMTTREEPDVPRPAEPPAKPQSGNAVGSVLGNTPKNSIRDLLAFVAEQRTQRSVPDASSSGSLTGGGETTKFMEKLKTNWNIPSPRPTNPAAARTTARSSAAAAAPPATSRTSTKVAKDAEPNKKATKGGSPPTGRPASLQFEDPMSLMEGMTKGAMSDFIGYFTQDSDKEARESAVVADMTNVDVEEIDPLPFYEPPQVTTLAYAAVLAEELVDFARELRTGMKDEEVKDFIVRAKKAVTHRLHSPEDRVKAATKPQRAFVAWVLGKVPMEPGSESHPSKIVRLATVARNRWHKKTGDLSSGPTSRPTGPARSGRKSTPTRTRSRSTVPSAATSHAGEEAGRRGERGNERR